MNASTINRVRAQARHWVFAFTIVAATFFQISAFGKSSIGLTWDPSEGDDVKGYKIVYGTAPGAYTETVSVGNVTNATVEGLIEGVEYYFAVTAYNSWDLESDPSNEVSHLVPVPLGLTMQSVTQDGVISLAISATGIVPEQWTLESSTELKNWSFYTNGAGGPINIQVPIGAGPNLFFRLKDE